MRKTKTQLLSCLLVLCLLLSAVPAAFAAEEMTADAQAIDEHRDIATDNEWAALKAINEIRKANGLDPVALAESLQPVAATRSAELGARFDNYRPDGRQWHTAISDAGISYDTATEFIARPFISGTRMVETWLENEPETLLGDYSHIAISHNLSNDYWCVLLINDTSADGAPYTGAYLHESGRRYLTAGESLESLGLIAVLTGAVGDAYVPLTDSLVTQLYTGVAGVQVGNFTTHNLSLDFTIEIRYVDVDYNLWYHDYIRYVTEVGLFTGVSSTEFAPEDPMTRAMFVTVLGRQAERMDLPIESSGMVFSDVLENRWYTPYIGWAAQNGIASGYGDGTFGINDEVTREQMAVFLMRFADYAGVELPDVSEQTDVPVYYDGDSVSSWAREAVTTCVALGMIDIHGGGVFEPGVSATRAEVAKAITILARDYID